MRKRLNSRVKCCQDRCEVPVSPKLDSAARAGAMSGQLQSLTDARHHAALLHEAGGLIDHPIPAIAKLHDARAWRARIEAEQRAGGGATPDDRRSR